MTENLESLSEENKLLTIEQESLKEKYSVVNQMLQSKTEELNQHKILLNKLELKNKKQNALFQVLLDCVVSFSLTYTTFHTYMKFNHDYL